MTRRPRRPVEPPRGEVLDRLREQLAVGVGEELLELALVHRSWSYENGGAPTNERLEFLGDAVLGLVVTQELYHRHPQVSEGRLAKLRAAVVNMRALAGVARGLDLGAAVRLGRGEEATGGRDKDSILADTTEAVIGAVHLDCGPDVARSLVLRLVGPLLDTSADLGAGLDWKTSLQELAAAHGLGRVEYLLTQQGPDHARTFVARAAFPDAPAGAGPTGDGKVGTVDLLGATAGTGRSKKEAEQQAAASAWRVLREGEGEGEGEDAASAGSAGVGR